VNASALNVWGLILLL